MRTAKEHLEKFGIRPSIQRVAVMSYLLNNRTHPTVDEIYSALLSTIPTLSRTTVYNTLKLLHDHGAVLVLSIDNSTTHYDGYTHPHAHFFCSECGRVFDVEMDDTEFVVRNRPQNAALITDEALYYKGVCTECLHKQKQS